MQMRSTVAACALLALLIGTAGAEPCPPSALGVSRTLVVDPSDHPRLGSMQYGETLPLNDREVVLTFDDGPLPPYTNRVLETLASECVKATFFMVGRMARGYPAMVRRIYEEGHTVANHSQSHPFTFHKMSVDHASREIEEGFASLREAVGDPNAVSPFFRIPGLLRQNSVEQYLAAHGDMTWSADFLADDWTRINNKEVAKRAINRIVARGRGILLLHDIQPRTALALPEILSELKARGFKIVHVVPATADRPKTVTEPQQWAVRRTPEQQAWGLVPIVGMDTPTPLPVLAAPNPASFGIERFGPTVKIALAQTLERQAGDPPPPAWPQPTASAMPEHANALPVPAAYNFRYSRPFRLGPAERPRVAANKLVAKKHAITTHAKPRNQGWGGLFGAQPQNRARQVGHQLSVNRPSSNTSGSQIR
jgi:peptidoglycan/xylan/chitin deacetylase (PgdA/CDA1 family)